MMASLIICVIILISAACVTSHKMIHLSFDDGPNIARGDKLLDLLKMYNISATFFIVGLHLDESQADHKQRRAMVQRILRDGHMIGSHTWSHHVFKQGESQALVANQLTRTEKVIQQTTGVRPYLFRAPQGILPRGTIAGVVADLGYTVCKWDIDSLDWMPNLKHSQMTNQLLSHWALQYSEEPKNAADANGAHVFHTGGRILFHEKKHTVDKILPVVIPELLSRGFVFGSLADVLDQEARARLYAQYACAAGTQAEGYQYRHWCQLLEPYITAAAAEIASSPWLAGAPTEIEHALPLIEPPPVVTTDYDYDERDDRMGMVIEAVAVFIFLYVISVNVWRAVSSRRHRYEQPGQPDPCAC